jgi:predicted Ser/Thr protein kinase
MVFKGTWQGTTPVALKTLKQKEKLDTLLEEAAVLKKFNHPNVVRYSLCL